MAPAISEAVRRFLEVNIGNVAQLELLLLLRAAPERWWTADEVARELRTRPEVAARDLSHLVDRGLATQDPEDPAHHRYAPGDLAADIDDLAHCYARRRTTVVGLIFAERSDEVTSLADAFRLRRK